MFHKYLIYNNESMIIEMTFESNNPEQYTTDGFSIVQVPLDSPYQVGDVYEPPVEEPPVEP